MSAATASPSARRSPLLVVMGWYGELRATHPARVLRWLRNGVLAIVAVTALLYVTAAVQGGHRIADARHTRLAVQEIDAAHDAAVSADEALTKAFRTGQVGLIGTGTDFANATAQVNTDVTLAAEGNAAGERGRTQIQFVQGQLITCQTLAETAVQDTSPAGHADAKDVHGALTAPQERDGTTPIPDTGGLTSSLTDLRALENTALSHQRTSGWLSPAVPWTLILGPALAVLLLTTATGYVLARHFRRWPDPRLTAAAALTAAVGITTGVLCHLDAAHLSAHPRAGHPVTTALALCALAAAGVLAYLAYRPRLAEYRFPRS